MFHDASSQVANYRVGIVDGSTGNGFTGAGVASHDASKMTGLCGTSARGSDARISMRSTTTSATQRGADRRRWQDVHEARFRVPRPPDRGEHVEKGSTKHRLRRDAEGTGTVAASPNWHGPALRLVQGDGHQGDNARTPSVCQRCPPTREVGGELEVGSCHARGNCAYEN